MTGTGRDVLFILLVHLDPPVISILFSDVVKGDGPWGRIQRLQVGIGQLSHSAVVCLCQKKVTEYIFVEFQAVWYKRRERRHRFFP